MTTTPTPNSNSLVTKKNNQDFTVNWQHPTTHNIHIDFEPLNKYVNEKSMRYTSIFIPYYEKSSVYQAYGKLYNSKNEKNAVAFVVEGRPYDSDEGKELVCKTFEELVHEPLSWNHEPKDATITYFEKDDTPAIIREIHKCIITGAEIYILPQDNMVVLRFMLLGLMEKDVAAKVATEVA